MIYTLRHELKRLTMSEKMEFEATIDEITTPQPILRAIREHLFLDLQIILSTRMEVTPMFERLINEQSCRFRVTLEPIEPELKPCPFCGGEALFDVSNPARWGWGNDYHVVKCSDCGARIRPSSVKEQTTAVWNRRASNE